MPAITVADQLGNTITLAQPPQRIISLVPSQTELLADLGLEQQVVGITKFCVHPAVWRKEKTIIGGTKNIDIARIRALNPDLIIGNKEENDQNTIEALQQEFPVWMSDVVTLEDAFSMMRGIGQLTGKREVADQLVSRIRHSMESIAPIGARALYLIWRRPWMGAGSGTFIHHMMERAGYVNCLQHLQRYPQLDDSLMQSLDPQVVLLSSEPFPFREKHMKEVQQLFPDAQVILADGELFSWYGSRMVHFAAYVEELRRTSG